MKILPAQWAKKLSPMSQYGIVLELDLNGKIIRSWHDPEGTAINDISEVNLFIKNTILLTIKK